MAANLEKTLVDFRQAWQFGTRSTIRQFCFATSSQPNDKDLAQNTATSATLFPNRTSWEPPEHDCAVLNANEILIASGWGVRASPLTITFDDFLVLCYSWKISPKVLEAIIPYNVELPNFFEYHLEEGAFVGNSDTQLCALHLAFKLDLRRHEYIMCIVRYDIHKRQMKALLFQCGVVGTHKHGTPISDSYDEVLQDSLEALGRDPLQLVQFILKRYMSRLIENFSRVCRQLYSTEGMIGVTTRARWLLSEGYTLHSKDYDDIGAKLYMNQIDITRLMICCSTLRVFAEQFQEIVNQIRHLSASSTSSNHYDQFYKQRSETESMIQRLALIKLELEYAQNRLNTQFNILYNLTTQRDSRLQLTIAEAAKRDSSTMRAISILTLVFLPATFVSTVFSTSIFDFQKWHSQHESTQSSDGTTGVVSMGWWIYLMCCILCTLIVSSIWYLSTRKELRISAAKADRLLESGLQSNEVDQEGVSESE